MENKEEPVWNHSYQVYLLSRDFIDSVIARFGKNDTFFRDMFNYRNLRDREIFKILGLGFPISKIYSDFPDYVVDDYLRLMGEEKVKKCLDTDNMIIPTIFDECDYFVDSVDMMDYWFGDQKLPKMADHYYRDFEHYVFEEIVENMSKRNRDVSYFVFRKVTD